ncbi:MAG TPA: DinB family protein [Gemmatimonadaceae bacterium]
MDEKTLFMNFWNQEAKTTSKVLSRIPEGSDYKPDPASRTAKDIAWQVVCEEKMLAEAMENGKADWNPPAMPATMKEVADEYDRQSKEISERFMNLPQERWDGEIEFFGHKRSTSSMAWSFLFDIIHHRGQISTYLRPMGAKVPQIYGPSHDEPMM